LKPEEFYDLMYFRDDWCKRFFISSLKGFWSVSFVLIFNMAFFWYYLILKGTPIHWSYFLGLYVLVLPICMMGFGLMVMEPYPTEKRFKMMMLEKSIKNKLEQDKSVYFE
jgi:hypothetical protein